MLAQGDGHGGPTTRCVTPYETRRQLLFAQEGARVAVTARREEPLAETAERATSAGGVATAFPGDVSMKSEAEQIVADVLSRYGRLDIVYCGAGGNFEPARGFAEVDESYWLETIGNTMNSIYNLAHAAQPVMREQGGGAIVAIAASFSVRQAGNPAYGAAKGRRRGNEAALGVRAVKSPQTPLLQRGALPPPPFPCLLLSLGSPSILSPPLQKGD